MRAMMTVGCALCFAAVCVLEGDTVSVIPALAMAVAGVPMMLVGAFKSGICD